MKKKTRNILIIIGVIVLICVAVLCGFIKQNAYKKLALTEAKNDVHAMENYCSTEKLYAEMSMNTSNVCTDGIITNKEILDNNIFSTDGHDAIGVAVYENGKVTAYVMQSYGYIVSLVDGEYRIEKAK